MAKVVELDVHRAFDLLGLNMDGKSNPFVKLSIGATSFTTEVRNATLFPEWNQHFSFPSVPLPASLTLNLFNKNNLFDTEEPLGTSNFLLFDNASETRKNVILNHGGNRELATKGLTGCGSLEISYSVGNALTNPVVAPAPSVYPTVVTSTSVPAVPGTEKQDPLLAGTSSPNPREMKIESSTTSDTKGNPTSVVHGQQIATVETVETVGSLTSSSTNMTVGQGSKPHQHSIESQPSKAQDGPRVIPHPNSAPDAATTGAIPSHLQPESATSTVSSPPQQPRVENVPLSVEPKRDDQRPFTPSGTAPLVVAPQKSHQLVTAELTNEKLASAPIATSKHSASKPTKRMTSTKLVASSKHKDPTSLPSTSVVASSKKIKELYRDVDALLQAALDGHQGLFEQLREVDPLLSHGFLELRDYAGRNPMHLAAWHGHLQVLETILKPVADGSQSRRPLFKFDTLTSAHGNTVLHSAALGGDLNTVAWLLQNARGIEVNIQAVNRRGLTPMQAAKEVGNAAVADLLAKYEPSHLQPVF